MNLLDRGYRVAYRFAYPLARKWWSIVGNDGVIMAVWLDDRVLAVQHSYKPGLRLPGGGIARGEQAQMTAVRELREEVGLTIAPHDVTSILTTSCSYGVMYLFEIRLTTMPILQVDRREIIHAEFVPPASTHEYNQGYNPDLARYLRSYGLRK